MAALALAPAARVLAAQAEPASTAAPAAAQGEGVREAEHAAPAGEAAHAEAAGKEEGHKEEGGNETIGLIARLVNFAILAGTLVYLLRSPIAKYLQDRSAQIRGDLVAASEMKETATAQIADIDRKMKALPAELAALRAQGEQEVAAEDHRIKTVAATERERLLEQARRDIDMHVKVAERELVSHAADLTVGLATTRIKNIITEDDQQRLVDRYVQQLKG